MPCIPYGAPECSHTVQPVGDDFLARDDAALCIIHLAMLITRLDPVFVFGVHRTRPLRERYFTTRHHYLVTSSVVHEELHKGKKKNNNKNVSTKQFFSFRVYEKKPCQHRVITVNRKRD